MTSGRAIVRTATAAPVLLALSLSVVPAAERTVAVPLPERATQPGVELTLDLFEAESARSLGQVTTRAVASGPLQLKVGSYAEICFTASAPGYVTLWSADPDTDRPTVLIYPNQYSHPDRDRAAQVEAGADYCVGDDEFRLRAEGRPGRRERVYLHWTPTLDAQFAPSDFPTIGRGVAPAATPYASTTIEYELTE